MLRTNRVRRPTASVQATRARGLAQVYAFSLLDSAILAALSDPTLRGLVHTEAERAQVLRELEALAAYLRTMALHTLAASEGR